MFRDQRRDDSKVKRRKNKPPLSKQEVNKILDEVYKDLEPALKRIKESEVTRDVVYNL